MKACGGPPGVGRTTELSWKRRFYVLREKSCGVVPFREVDGQILYLVISSAVTKREHWEFPKGGVEEGEREVETALRELREETGVTDVELLPGYREPIRYIYRRAEGLVFKQVVYFIGRVKDPTIVPRREEVKDYRWATYEEARRLLRHGNARELLYRCHAFITGQPLPPRPKKRRRRRRARGGHQAQAGASAAASLAVGAATAASATNSRSTRARNGKRRRRSRRRRRRSRTPRPPSSP